MEMTMEEIYQAYRNKVMGYICARVRRRADAEDLCSAVFEKIFLKLDSFEEAKASLNTWVFTVTRNTVIDYFRRNRPTEELDENLADDGELDEEMLNTESLEELAAALRALPDEMRRLIVLRYYDGKPLTQVAEEMGLSYGAVKLRHQAALARLRRSLEGT